MKPTLLVMAAGMGSRFGGLKQVEPIGPNGETLLDYSVFDALRAGFGRVVFVIRKDFETLFRERVCARFSGKIEVAFVYQELDELPEGTATVGKRQKPWGTGHAVWCARREVRGPFAVINADDFYGRAAFEALAAFLDKEVVANTKGTQPTFAMIGYRLADTLSEHGTVSRGVCATGREGRLERIEETTAIAAAPDGAGRVKLDDGHERLLPPDTIVSMNCWGFTTDVFGLLEGNLVEFLKTESSDPKAEFHLPAAIEQAVQRTEIVVRVLPVRTSWFGVTHAADKPRVVESLVRLIEAGDYPKSLWT
jgi:UTP-glucose-1-phosphate uridylyltransferase